VVLTRNNDVVAISDPTGLNPLGPQQLGSQLSTVLPAGSSALTYGDSRRASVRGEWRRDLYLPDGIRIQPLLEARADLYNIPDGTLTVSNGVVNTMKPSNAINGIGQGTAGFTASWPFIRDTGRTSIIIEPIIQALVSPNYKPDRNIPNEDSVAFEYDDTTLFEPDRFPGFDLYESGARVNVGARSSFVWDTHSASLTVGQTYRTQPDPVFTIGSGLQGHTSDYVYFAQVSPLAGTNFFIRSRLDAETLQVRRNEAGIDVGWQAISGSIRYLYNESGFFIDPQGQTQIGRVEDATIAGTWFFRKNWGVSVNATRDLRLKTTPAAQIGFIYRDECIRVDVVYTRDETYQSAIGASNSIGIRLTLATLGDTGSPFRPAAGGR
jgi:LPS-assembly protein